MSDGEGSASGDLGRRKSLDAAKAGVSVAFKELRESGEVTSESGVEFLRKIEDKVEEAFLQVSDWLSEELMHQKAHLVLMQNQVDKQQHQNQKQHQELLKLIEMEKAQRVLSQRSSREHKEKLEDQLASFAEEISLVNERREWLGACGFQCWHI
mmetsp:Transcript_11739/g.35690  ORF Transcript_11739/g.35690 Transcript_11739/m.35690 type:complete len:154 (-) Transcript_11739:419-880(-)